MIYSSYWKRDDSNVNLALPVLWCAPLLCRLSYVPITGFHPLATIFFVLCIALSGHCFLRLFALPAIPVTVLSSALTIRFTAFHRQLICAPYKLPLSNANTAGYFQRKGLNAAYVVYFQRTIHSLPTCCVHGNCACSPVNKVFHNHLCSIPDCFW